MKICIILPSYNEAENIGRLIEEIRKYNHTILIIDDGSSDATSVIAKNQGAIVIKNNLNQGKGFSLNIGFQHALKNGYDAVITLDADGQHLPEEIPQFILKAQISNAGIIIGNRMSQRGNMPFIRILTNAFMSWLLSNVNKQYIPDTQCGFRLIRKEVLAQLHLLTRKFETESEILIKASKLGFKIESIPIKSVYLNSKSHINPFIDTARFIKLIVKELWTTHY